MQRKKLCTLTKPLENTISPLYTSCFGVQRFLRWPLKTNHKLSSFFFFFFLLAGRDKVNVSRLLAQRCWRARLVKLTDKNPNQPTTPVLHNTPASVFRRMSSEGCLWWTCCSIQVHNRPFTTGQVPFVILSNDVWSHFASVSRVLTCKDLTPGVSKMCRSWAECLPMSASHWVCVHLSPTLDTLERLQSVEGVACNREIVHLTDEKAQRPSYISCVKDERQKRKIIFRLKKKKNSLFITFDLLNAFCTTVLSSWCFCCPFWGVKNNNEKIVNYKREK